MKPIKTIAGEILLYFYYIQRESFSKLNNSMVRFNFTNQKMSFNGRDGSIFNFDKFESYSDNDIYNAINYLSDSYLVSFKESKDNMGSNLFSFRLTSTGFDLIESIEHGDDEKKNFNLTFNFNINNEVTIESLLKAEFGSLIKASLM